LTIPPHPSLPNGIPGPLDRVSFFEAQQRNRRSTWKFSALSAFAIFLMGLPLSLILTPLLYAFCLIVFHLLALIVKIPPSVWNFFTRLAWILKPVLDHFDHPEKPLPLMNLSIGLIVVFLPGILLMVLLGLGIRTLFRRSGTEGLLKSLQAREPKAQDLEERQLVNVVEEMALAAGIPTPRVLLIDAPAANAAAIGSSEKDAVLLVTRPVLDEFNRDETQGLIGHLIASIGNGDLAISQILLSLFQTFGMLQVILLTPFGPQSRSVLRGMLRLTFGSKNPEEAEKLGELLTQVGPEGKDDLDQYMDEKMGSQKTLTGCMRAPMIPLIWSCLSIRITLFFFITLLVGPMLSLLWRSRRYLADATAVQLTRNPDGLAHALQHLQSCGGYVPGGLWANYLFLMDGKQGRSENLPPEMLAEMQKLSTEMKDMPLTQRMQKFAEIRARYRSEAPQGEKRNSFEAASGAGTFLSWNPPLKRRIKRLDQMGATVALAPASPTAKWATIFIFLLLSPLFILLIYLVGLVVAMVIGLNLVFMSISLALIHAFFQLFH